MKKLLFCLLVCGLFVCVDAVAVVRMPAVFGNNMVLQQSSDAALWGWADAAKTLTVTTSWDQKSYTQKVGADGKWRLSVATPAAGGPYSIVIDDGTKLELRNVMIGEVWICSGQSNMTMLLKGNSIQPVNGSLEAIMTSGKYRDRIRSLTLPRRESETPQDDFKDAVWQVSEPAVAPNFSALAFFFARYLTESLGVPVGIICSSWGGSDIEAWMDAEHNRKAKPGISIPASEKTPVAKQPVKLYNGMICPIAGYTARGFLWYQGEGNTKNEGYRWYTDQLDALVANWRSDWGSQTMPFYIVQIAPYNRQDSRGLENPLLVEAQLKAASRIPLCGIVPTTDVGEPDCIHPAEKQTIGLRLANLAMVSLYGMKGMPATGPVYKDAKFMDGRASVEFDNTALGLMPARGESIVGFEIAGADKVFYPAKATVSKNVAMVSVSSEKVAQPVAVRYAFRNYIEANLRNTYGVAAFPFRTDDWNDVK